MRISIPLASKNNGISKPKTEESTESQTSRNLPKSWVSCSHLGPLQSRVRRPLAQGHIQPSWALCDHYTAWTLESTWSSVQWRLYHLHHSPRSLLNKTPGQRALLGVLLRTSSQLVEAVLPCLYIFIYFHAHHLLIHGFILYHHGACLPIINIGNC